MPIRRELRSFYSSLTWRAIRARILERAGGQCERCGKPDRKMAWVVRDGTGRWWPRGERPAAPGAELHYIKTVLTVAHLNHDHDDNRDENLLALCQGCHLRHDGRFHHANARRTRARRVGQAWLTEEFEHANAPGPEWLARQAG